MEKKMKNIYNKIAFFLIILSAIPTLKEGLSVIIGNDPEGMIVLHWLVYYNVLMAFYSFFVGYLLWIQSTNRLKMASIVFLGHILVFSYLLFTYFTSGMVAQKSVFAMAFRSTLWAIILFLIRKGFFKN